LLPSACNVFFPDAAKSMSPPESSTLHLGKTGLEAKGGSRSKAETRDLPEAVLLQNEVSSEGENDIERGRKLKPGPLEPSDGDTRQMDETGIKGNGQDGAKELEKKTQTLSVSPGPGLAGVDNAERNAEGQDLANSAHDRGLGDEFYLDPTPKTPRQETSPSREAPGTVDNQVDEGSTSEIQSIMDQFDDGDDTGENLAHTTLDTNVSHLKSPMEHPPRRSSLEPLRSAVPGVGPESTDSNGLSTHSTVPALLNDESTPSDIAAETSPMRTSSLPQSNNFYASDTNVPTSPNVPRSMSKMPPPAPDPEPDLPFDFHRFLEQLRHRTADPVAKFLRSFLIEFGKKQWMVHEQVKIINDFLTFITGKMAQCEVWRGVSDAEFDNAKEGMEKLVMNRLYSQTFSPAVPAATPVQGSKGKKKNMDKSLAPGRKGQHQEDIERDEILGQKVRIYGWVQEEHLDIPPIGDSGRRFLVLAQQGKAEIAGIRQGCKLTQE